MHAISIRILEKDNNRRGDLFGRLMSDLFVALGYEPPALNIQKAGRELDLSTRHRVESRVAIAECKATSDPIGGDDINKFVGALDAEQDGKLPVTGYFISLAGFRETAIEQEKQRQRTRIALLTGPQVIDHLIQGRMLVSKDRATEMAGRCCSGFNSIALDSDAELLAHERGWIWAIYFTQGKARTHFALIHSDGTPLAKAVADEVIVSDRLCGGGLHQLACLNPNPRAQSSTTAVAQALSAYMEYLEAECGFIQLDGLPADTEVGSRRLRLENLFVPLHLDLTKKQAPAAVEKGKRQEEVESQEGERRPVGIVLAEHPRLALLAAPGGGKSTLLKRIAVAYADPARREQIADDLPQREWLPLFIRCRELRSLARGSFAELLEALSQREPVRQHASAFRSHVDRMLLAGSVLLLVDGLDEISDAGDRAAFVCTIRAALQAYPGVAIVVTSREAGFRHVAAHLAPICTRATLSPFNEGDITRLSIAWHREVMNDSNKVRLVAEELAATIVKNDRIRRLAINPLLLTTLLLVKRWVGSLPTRRAVLYGKAVELLLMTWNVEGHEPIPQEEALPQLCYVASAMMLNGIQKISRPRLAALLKEARNAMPTELGYVKGTVDAFIHRVEDRSSLLMMTGLDVEEGQLVEFFEFRHLTFQEFLTAKAMVEGWHPGRQEEDTLAGVLEPHFAEEEWAEVIPLAAVLGGKATELLVQRMTHEIKDDMSDSIAEVLGSSLADEAAARPDTIRAALRGLAQINMIEETTFVEALSKSRYGADFREEARRVFEETVDNGEISSALSAIIASQTLESMDTGGICRAIVRYNDAMKSKVRVARYEGALGLLDLAYELNQIDGVDEKICENLNESKVGLVTMVLSNDSAEQCAASWAICWLAHLEISLYSEKEDILGRLFILWRHSNNANVRHFARWALASHPLVERSGLQPCHSVPRHEIDQLLKHYDELEPEGKHAALVVAWYLNATSDEEIAAKIDELERGSSEQENRLGELRERVDN
ncbi:MAG: NACHT domain-containing protein [Terriglobales bacterium]